MGNDLFIDVCRVGWEVPLLASCAWMVSAWSDTKKRDYKNTKNVDEDNGDSKKTLYSFILLNLKNSLEEVLIKNIKKRKRRYNLKMVNAIFMMIRRVGKKATVASRRAPRWARKFHV